MGPISLIRGETPKISPSTFDALKPVSESNTSYSYLPIKWLAIPCLTLVPVPVVSMILTLLLELVDVFTGGVAVNFLPVVAPASILAQTPADVLGHLVHLVGRIIGVGVLALVSAATAGIDRGSSKQEK